MGCLLKMLAEFPKQDVGNFLIVSATLFLRYVSIMS